MADHPPSYLLEEFAAGEIHEHTTHHIEACEACRAYVEKLRRGSGEFAEHKPTPFEFADQVVARSTNSSKGMWLTGGAISLVAAAAVLWLFVQPAAPPPEPVAMISSAKTTDPAGVRFKGTLQLAVIRQRDGQQVRLGVEAGIRASDRLRVELSVDSTVQLEVGVLSTDGTWATLMPPTMLSPGTHLTPQAVRFDDAPTSGWVLAGPPEAVKRARESRNFQDVTVLPLHVETDR